MAANIQLGYSPPTGIIRLLTSYVGQAIATGPPGMGSHLSGRNIVLTQ